MEGGILESSWLSFHSSVCLSVCRCFVHKLLLQFLSTEMKFTHSTPISIYVKLCMFNFMTLLQYVANLSSLNFAIFCFCALTQKAFDLGPRNFIQVLLMIQGGFLFVCLSICPSLKELSSFELHNFFVCALEP